MELNNTQHKSFFWNIVIEPFTWHILYGEQCPPFVAWKQEMGRKISVWF